MNYADYYFEQKFGCYPYKEQDAYAEVDKVIDYLKDNGLDESKIVKFLNESCQSEGSVRKELNRQEWLREDSLLKPDTFYYHPLLQIQSPAPFYDPFEGMQKKVEFYREIRLKFTLDDLLSYAYSKLGLITALMDTKRDRGSIEYLLSKYSKINFVQPVDFLLYLIDEASRSHKKIATVLEISEFEMETYESLSRHVNEARAKKTDVIAWR